MNFLSTSWRVRWSHALLLALSGPGAAAACSDSGFSGNSAGAGTSNAAGQGGEAPASAAGKGGSSTSSAGDGMTSGGEVSGGAEASSGGEAGAPSTTPLGSTCLACAANATSAGNMGNGCPALTACDASPTCKLWADCVRACSDDVCAAQCDAQHPDVARTRADVYACLCQSCDASCTPIAACDRKCDASKDLKVQTTAPATLAETQLYSSGVTIAAYAQGYQPKYPLWSDGASKDRHVYLPACAKIDTSDMDHWSFPVGTRFWKEFKIASNDAGNPNGALVETRFIHRFGPGADDWLFAAYQWPQDLGGGIVPDPAQAKLVEAGVVNANGTTHDIPSTPQCKNCHTKLSERILSFGAIQLSHNLTGLKMSEVSDDGWLTVPARDGFAPPGNGSAQAALGYLHANCGNCHNASFKPVEPPPLMRLLVGVDKVTDTDTYKSLVNVPTINVDFKDLDRIEPGDAAKSEIIVRMGRRLPQTGQMPPLGTKVAHAEGIAAVTAWINLLPKQ